MTSSYHDLDNESLISLFKTHYRNLATLEKQAAEFGSLYVPVSIINQINDERQAIEAIKAELLNRGYSLSLPSEGEFQRLWKPSWTIFQVLRWDRLIIGSTAILFMLITIVVLIVLLPGGPAATPLPTTTMPVSSNAHTILEVRRIPENDEIEVLWENLPQISNSYLMTSDETRYYDPRPIYELSGQQKIPLNNGITSVVIVISEYIIPGKFPPYGIEIGDPSIPIDVKIKKPIPEQ